jgi:Arc/MetJ family transcription regulator
MYVAYILHMRTSIDLPEDLVEEARRSAGLRTIRETVIAALEELVRKSRREELRAMAGTLALDLDVPKARKRRGAR